MEKKCVWCKEVKPIATSCSSKGETRYICKDCYAEISQISCEICNTILKLSSYGTHLMELHNHHELVKGLVKQKEFNVLFYPKYV